MTTQAKKQYLDYGCSFTLATRTWRMFSINPERRKMRPKGTAISTAATAMGDSIEEKQARNGGFPLLRCHFYAGPRSCLPRVLQAGRPVALALSCLQPPAGRVTVAGQPVASVLPCRRPSADKGVAMLSIVRCQVRCRLIGTECLLESIGTRCPLGLVGILALPVDLTKARLTSDLHLTWRLCDVTKQHDRCDGVMFLYWWPDHYWPITKLHNNFVGAKLAKLWIVILWRL
ncbi:hypothetical protein GW17_00055645 [Ensete ventricosum]|nr:hypothetical protein GW17_00055645 [Ensete ventricosum]